MTLRTALLRRSGSLHDGRPFVIRPMRSDDAAAVVALRDSVAAEGEYILARPGERSVAEEILALAGLLSEGGLSLVADVDAAVAAHLLVQRRVEQPAVADLAIIVINTCRDNGLGTALMRTALDWARAVRVASLRLCVLPGNERAIALYRSIGFSEQGAAQAEHTTDHAATPLLLMGMELR